MDNPIKKCDRNECKKIKTVKSREKGSLHIFAEERKQCNCNSDNGYNSKKRIFNV